MDRYRKVEKPKLETAIDEKEIRITFKGLVRNYITYATTLLQEKNESEIVLKAMGQAINKAVSITEIIKRRIPQLHQDTVISSVNLVDVWEPIEEGLLPVETSRNVSMISITLSTKELNKNSPGYQAPVDAEQARQQQQSRPQKNQQQQSRSQQNSQQQQQPQNNSQQRQQKNYQQQQPSKLPNDHQQQQQPRTQSNQQRQPSRQQNNYQQQELSRTQDNYQQLHPQHQPTVVRQARQSYNAANEDSYGRDNGGARGRGRGRGRGRSRGEYGNYEGNYRGNYEGNYRGNYQMNYQDNYQDTGNYRNWGQRGGHDGGYGRGGGYARGRGGGRGRGGYGRSRGRMGNYARDDPNQE